MLRVKKFKFSREILLDGVKSDNDWDLFVYLAVSFTREKRNVIRGLV